MTWESGYRNVQIWFRERLVATIANPSSLKKGIKIKDEELNEIELSFSERPMTIDVVIDGYHCPTNRSHPLKTFKLVNKSFWVIFILAVLGTLINLGQLKFSTVENQIQFGIDLVFTTSYLIAAISTAQGKVWFYFLGLSVFTVSSLLYIFTIYLISAMGIGVAIGILIRIGVLIYLLRFLKTAISTNKHKYYEISVDENLLDS